MFEVSGSRFGYSGLRAYSARGVFAGFEIGSGGNPKPEKP